MHSRTSRRLAALTLLLLLLTPSLLLARPRQTACCVAPAGEPGLIDLLRTSLVQLLNKVYTTSGGTTTTPAPTPTPTPTPAPGDGAGVRIDPEGMAAIPSPTTVRSA